jgi:hypothetical protein
MRARALSLLMVAVSAAPLHAHAATPVNAVAANIRGQVIRLSTAQQTLTLNETATSIPVTAKLTCVSVERFKSGIFVPPSRVIPLTVTFVRVRAKAGGVTYYMFFQSFARPDNKTRQAITAMGINKRGARAPCGANSNLTNAAGIALYG